MLNREGGSNERLLQILGKYPTRTGVIPNNDKDKSQFSCARYKFFLDAPFEISNRCCSVMKKAPAKLYTKTTGRKPFIATMAAESKLRTQVWLKSGCNGFDSKLPASTPLSFWTEQDILKYIKENNIKICSVYGNIVTDYGEEIDGQLSLADLGLCSDNRKLKTTGCSRTGCMFCLFGAHLEKAGDGRLEKMKITHPQIYDYIMRSEDKGGLNYKEIIDWINENGSLDIRY